MDIFDENNRYTSKGMELDGKVKKALDPIFKEWGKDGCSPRDISHIIILTAIMFESEIILTKGYKKAISKYEYQPPSF